MFQSNHLPALDAQSIQQAQAAQGNISIPTTVKGLCIMQSVEQVQIQCGKSEMQAVGGPRYQAV